MTQEVNLNFRQAELLVKWLEVLRQGIVKPNDITTFYNKVDRLNISDPEIEKSLLDCCPTDVVVHDCKDFQPYIQGINEKLAALLGITVVEYGGKRSSSSANTW